ncbi:DNA glycosylase [Tanacetum coccineum]|uniref:DNA glycosylase n=1 Tax=Tanacetum coccineum TaxID=301880 RepID=A0ABQ5IL39_9ASTR
MMIEIMVMKIGSTIFSQCHMLILLLMGSYVVKDGNESTPGDMIWYKEIVPQLTLIFSWMQSKLDGKQVTKRPNIITAKIQTTDEVGSSSGSKLVATDSPAFEALRRAHVNEISDAIRGRGMNNLLADRLKGLFKSVGSLRRRKNPDDVLCKL